jgi:hypothetical protein
MKKLKKEMIQKKLKFLKSLIKPLNKKMINFKKCLFKEKKWKREDNKKEKKHSKILKKID